MEFNVFQYFKGFERSRKDPMTPEEQGVSYFLGGHMGERISEHLDQYAAKAKVSRRDFLKTASGFAAAMLAVNKITGMKFFDVQEAEAYEAAAVKEMTVAKKMGTEFIVDQHTHICWRKDGYIQGVNTTEKGMWFVQLLDDLGKAMGLPNGTRDMTVENFGKLILEGSDTSVAIFNPFGFREDYGGKDMVPIEEQAEVKQRWPDRTIMLGGGLTPNQGLGETLDRLQMFVEDYKISGLKLYTFDSTPKRGWWFDDERMAYPIWEKCRKLGLKNIGCHKGIPFGQFMARYAHAEDFDAVADDFTDLNWIAFHSGWPYQGELAALKGFKPQRKNLFTELGSTFAATVTNRPVECAHILGTLLRDLGTDSVMWGTDSALWGNPQWQIDAFRRFRIPDQLIEGYGYPQLTDEVKAKVFGLNASRLWNLKVMANTEPAATPKVVAV
ncbi:MAG: amidohydrolase [candidate division NC10 bacterium]|nr:amidohydrolase [candidate division NC10 bacterium]